MKKHSGIFLLYEDNFLILHRTWKNSIIWTIPTVHIKDFSVNEEERIREKVKQLTNIDSNYYKKIIPLGEENNTYGNLCLSGYYAYLNKYKFKVEKIQCNYMVTDSGKGEPFPAIDKYMWINRSKADRFLPKEQLSLLEGLPDANL